MKRFFFLHISAFFFVGCVSTYKYNFDSHITKLEEKKKIAITVSEDGFYGTDIYAGSGMYVSRNIKNNIEKYATKTKIIKKESIDDLTSEELESFDYIFVPRIIHWEDRATAWSALPDKIEILIEVYDSNKNLLISSSFSGESKSMTLGTTDPTELVDEPVKEFILSIF